MDPDANLTEQLELSKKLIHCLDNEPEPPELADIERLAELVLALNDWIRRGGFLPKLWNIKE